MADTKSSNMPLQGEMQLANWISNMFSNKTANPNYTGGTVPNPVLAPTMTAQDMQNLMTEYMRGDGRFLQQMQQGRTAGLYNSSTSNLIANDITAQAALKASSANQNINAQNAQILNTFNQRQAIQQPKYLPNGGNQNAALGGLAIAGLQKLLGGGISLGGSTKKKSDKEDARTMEEADLGTAGILGGIAGGLDLGGMFESVDLSGTSPVGGFDIADLGGGISNFTEGLSNINLGGLSDFDLGSFELPDFDFGSFELPDFDLFDFDFDSWF